MRSHVRGLSSGVEGVYRLFGHCLNSWTQCPKNGHKIVTRRDTPRAYQANSSHQANLRTIIRGRIIAKFLSLLWLKKKTSLQVLGERIRAARKNLRMSQEDLALESDIDRSYIGGVERGERNLSFKKLCSVAGVIGLDLGELCADLPVIHERSSKAMRAKP